MKRIKAFLLSLAMLLGLICTLSAGTVCASAVAVSNQEYEVFFAGRHSQFLCNKKSAGNAVGTEYYLTYTVKSVASSGSQNGFLGTCAPEEQFPYIDGNGLLYYQQRKSEKETPELLMAGYTYFVKFTVTDTGYRYLAARAKDDSSEYIVIESKAAVGDRKDTNYGYFGLWFGDGVTDAHLTDVRFYDAAGNDLGVWSPRSLANVVKCGEVEKDTKVDHWYRVAATEQINLAISNQLPLTTDRMVVEFTVAEAESTCTQAGIALSNYPQNTYPHANGLLKYESVAEGENSFLLEPGAEYLLVLDKGNFGFSAYVQITKNGETTTKVFPNISGAYDKDAQFFSLWFGTGQNGKSSFVFENVKIYDGTSNNLGVQANNSNVQIRHFGSMLDYAACEAVYYCKETGAIYTLYKDNTLTYEEGGNKKEGTYSVRNNQITIVISGESKTYDYLYSGFTAENSQYFKRLYTYQVKFVAGNGSEDQIQIMDMENGYLARKPADPVLDGCTFEGWCTSDGAAYEFENMVTESVTVYAKWTNGAGVTYLATENDSASEGATSGVVIIIICAIMAVAAGVLCFVIIKGGFKRDKNTQ